MAVRIMANTKAYDAYRALSVIENYYCNFGINPGMRHQLAHPDLIFSGVDQDDEIRILELKHHDFFMATLFVPQSRSTREAPHPIIRDFIAAAAKKSEHLLQK
jgi:CTP synthase (UTP-ammonia lyase)